MAIQYAPYIDGILPAFRTQIKIPFRMNPAVAPAQVKGFMLRVMDLNNKKLKHITVTANSSMFVNKEVVFDNNVLGGMEPQNFYKVQLAYMSNLTETEIDLTFSTVGVIKRTTNYSFSWVGFGNYQNNMRYNSFTLNLSTIDCNEPVYSYRFQIKNVQTGEIFYQDKEPQLHNVETDILQLDSSKDMRRYASIKCVVNKIYNPNTRYIASCEVTTINNYNFIATSSAFTPITITDKKINNLIFTIKQKPEDGDYEEGRVSIRWKGNIPNSNYFIRRSGSNDGYTTWSEIYSFAKTVSNEQYDNTWNDKIKQHEIHDYTVEQGVHYRYYMVAYNSNGTFTAQQQALTNENGTADGVYVDFEYIYLTDKDRQLKVKYKGAISNIKMTIQEQKIDTIGSQFPFFSRNGNLRYAEIPISGLISYHADENELFMTRAELGLEGDNTRLKTDAGSVPEKHLPTTALTGYNFKAERDFKLAVRDWLMNGKPKLVRSPGEGNYIVRLMNVSLSPEQGTSNMIHNFSATGYQIAETTYEKMKECDIVKW